MDNGIYKFGTSSVFTLNGNNNIRCTKDSVSNLTFDEDGMVCGDYEEGEGVGKVKKDLPTEDYQE